MLASSPSYFDDNHLCQPDPSGTIYYRQPRNFRISVHSSTVLSSFAIIFVAELPDKTMISSVIMGSKMIPVRVFIGASAAFFLQVILAVTVGAAVSGVPRRPLEVGVGLVFLLGAILIVREIYAHETETEESRASAAARRGFLAQVLLAFGITFIGEFGDLTQIAAANLAAKTGDPLSVGVGSFAGLIAVTSIGIFFGAKVVSKVPIKMVQVVGSLLMAILGVASLISAI